MLYYAVCNQHRNLLLLPTTGLDHGLPSTHWEALPWPETPSLHIRVSFRMRPGDPSFSWRSSLPLFHPKMRQHPSLLLSRFVPAGRRTAWDWRTLLRTVLKSTLTGTTHGRRPILRHHTSSSSSSIMRSPRSPQSSSNSSRLPLHPVALRRPFGSTKIPQEISKDPLHQRKCMSGGNVISSLRTFRCGVTRMNHFPRSVSCIHHISMTHIPRLRAFPHQRPDRSLHHRVSSFRH